MAVRLWYTSVSGFPRSWLTTHMPYASNPLSPRHTGRADFPHPAFPDTFAIGVRKELTARSLDACKAQVGDQAIPGAPLRRADGPLAPTTQMTVQPAPHKTVDLPKRGAGVAQVEVVRPADQVSIQI